MSSALISDWTAKNAKLCKSLEKIENLEYVLNDGVDQTLLCCILVLHSDVEHLPRQYYYRIILVSLMSVQ